MTTPAGSSEVQNKVWSPTASERSRWVSRHLRSLWEAMQDAARVQPGSVLLDAGCGSGEAVSIAVERGAKVSGMDASEQMLAVARENVPSVEFLLGDLEALTYPDKHFDAITACNSVHFAKRPERAVQELARVLKPGGRVAICTMNERALHDVTRVVFEPAFSLLKAPPPVHPYALAKPGALEGMVTAAGLRVATNLAILAELHVENFDQAWSFWQTIGPIASTVNEVGADRVREAIFRAAGENGVIKDDGEVVLRDWFHVVVGEAPRAS